MPYAIHRVLDFGPNGTGKTLTVNLYPTDSDTATETDVGSVHEYDDGFYCWKYDSVPDSFDGAAIVFEGSTRVMAETITAPDRTILQLMLSLMGASDVIWVATTGNDSNTGRDFHSPKLTLRSALGVATSGDTIIMLPGAYADSSASGHVIPAGVKVKGCGWATKLTLSNLISSIRMGNDSELADIWIDAGASVTSAIYQSNSVTAEASFRINNCWIKGGSYGVWLLNETYKQESIIKDSHIIGGIAPYAIGQATATSLRHEMTIYDSYGLADAAVQAGADSISYGVLCQQGRMRIFNSVIESTSAKAAQATGAIHCGDPTETFGNGEVYLAGTALRSRHTAGGTVWDILSKDQNSQVWIGPDCNYNRWSVEQSNGGRIFDELLNIHTKVSILQGGESIYYASANPAHASNTPISHGHYVLDSYDTIQGANDAASFGDAVYALPGASGEAFAVTGSTTMSTGVDLHGVGIDRTKISYTGAGEADSVTNPIIVLSGINRVEDLTITENTTTGVGGIVHLSGAGTIVLDHVKANVKRTAVVFSSTTAIAAAVENCTLKAGQYAIQAEDAAHTIYLAGDHQFFDVRESYSPAGVDLDLAALHLRNGSDVYGEAWLNSEATTSARTVHGIDAGAGTKVVLAGSIATSNTGNTNNETDIDADGALCVVCVAGCNYEQRKTVTANGGRILDSAAHMLVAADKVVDTGTTPYQVKHIERGTTNTIMLQDLKDPSDGNVTSESTRVGRQVTPP